MLDFIKSNLLSWRQTRHSLDEARAIVEAKHRGLIDKPYRPTKKITDTVNLDFRVKGEYSHCDIKTPVGSKILKMQNQAETLSEMSVRLGESIAQQNHRFVGRPYGPKTPERVLHVIDLWYVPYNEKFIVMENIFKGLANEG